MLLTLNVAIFTAAPYAGHCERVDRERDLRGPVSVLKEQAARHRTGSTGEKPVVQIT